MQAELHTLRPRLNRGKSRVRRRREGVTFLGFTVHPKTVRLGPIAVRRARRRQTTLQRAFAVGLPWAEVKARL